MKFPITGLVVLLALGACSTRLQVTSYPTQHEKQLGSSSSFCWAENAGDANALEKLEPVGGHHNSFDALIRATAEADLKAKGFVLTDCSSAGFELDYRMGTHTDVAAADASSSNAMQANPYGPRWSIGDDNTVSYEGLKKPRDNVIVVRHGTIHIAAFTAQNTMLWHSSAEKILNDQDSDETKRTSIVLTVHALLKDFPSHQ